MEFKRKKTERGIVVEEHTLWKKTEIAVLAYFSSNNNKPTTYREIARAYVSSSYSNYRKACEALKERAYLEKLEDGKFRVNDNSWKQVKRGTETSERSLPYLQVYKKKLKKR